MMIDDTISLKEEINMKQTFDRNKNIGQIICVQCCYINNVVDKNINTQMKIYNRV